MNSIMYICMVTKCIAVVVVAVVVVVVVESTAYRDPEQSK